MCLRHTPAEACAPFSAPNRFPAGHVGPTLVSDASSAFCLHLGRGTPRVWYQDMKQSCGDVMRCLGATICLYFTHMSTSLVYLLRTNTGIPISRLLIHDTCLDCTRTCFLQERCGSKLSRTGNLVD
ncbi:hypothetical protein J3E69DRAFT_327815 [Trichoderma sp. SZMC 28015]